jgi:hypothetical protein
MFGINDKKIMLMKVFKDNLIDFITELTIQFPQEADLHIIKIFFEEVCTVEEIIVYFCNNLLVEDVKKMIDTKNEKFFLKNDQMFTGIKNQSKVFHFKKLWESSDKHQKDMIWQWVQKITKIAELYTMA